MKPSDFCLPSLFVSLRSSVHSLPWNCNLFSAKFLEFSGYLVEFISLCTHHCFYLATQSCPALSYLLDYSPPGSSVHGIFQARLLEWVAISFSSAFRQYYLPNSKKKNSVSLCRFLYVLKFHPYPALLSVTYRKRVQYFKDKFSLIPFLYLNTHTHAHTHTTHTPAWCN